MAIAEAWQDQRSSLLASAEKINAHLDIASPQGTGAVDRGLLDRTYHMLSRIYDADHGGFGRAPKFPQPGQLSFLLNYHYQTGQASALDMVTHTLDVMARAGMYDHLGGGFHRYATDDQWLVPHFEKMLYDQALISGVYLDAFKITKNREYQRIVCETLDYVLRDLRDPGGAFYSAEDADSEGHEGKFYVWTPEQIQAILDDDQARVFRMYYGVTESGNYELGQSILNVTRSLEAVASDLGVSLDRAEARLQQAEARLLDVRASRVRPHRDTKIITAWNGLFISSLARAGAALNRPDYLLAARTAAREVLDRLEKDGQLMRSLAMGKVSGPGFLDDYAFFIAGLLDLYESTFETQWLAQAHSLADRMIELFGDSSQPGFYMAAQGGDALLARRPKPDYDGVVPSGNSMAALSLARLGHMTGNAVLTEKAESLIKYLGACMEASPGGLTAGACALAFWLLPKSEIILVGNADDPNLKAMQQRLHQAYMPNTVALRLASGGEDLEIEALSPRARDLVAINGAATAYVCEGFACQNPVSRVEEFTLNIQAISTPGKK
jgi:uncharacterized protein YyaL (SSP411 family)